MESNFNWSLLIFFTICQSSNNEIKSAKDTLQAFKKGFSKKTPEKLWVDNGSELSKGELSKILARRKTLEFTQQVVKQKLQLQREPFNN